MSINLYESLRVNERAINLDSPIMSFARSLDEMTLLQSRNLLLVMDGLNEFLLYSGIHIDNSTVANWFVNAKRQRDSLPTGKHIDHPVAERIRHIVSSFGYEENSPTWMLVERNTCAAIDGLKNSGKKVSQIQIKGAVDFLVDYLIDQEGY